MKIARIEWHGRELYARVDQEYHVLDADNLTAALTAEETGEKIPTSARLLSPVTPSKVVALACAYLADDRPFDPEKDRAPFIFFKPSSAVVGTRDNIEVPEVARGSIFESELAVVMAKDCKKVTEDEALEYVLGYTICNDMSAPALMGQDGQWSRGKGLDTFCPIGPWIETELDNPDDAHITAHLTRNGQRLDLVDSSTRYQIWSAAQAISYCSEYITLKAGDVISLGCPPGPIPVEEGDTVSITIDGIGTLENPVHFI
ncbi:fumarylacetoacetate hydrolase family protein [Corynebacterium sp. ES2794-CONJ1]|uniref:fumarylacetoacetate hydrolase family protein n=1 Tax=unclassified Corynebacterium TaxID=2624378 RepID=UPI002169AE7C|nr:MULTISPECIES: fumarylacetoacetate hydrolase family protein [unclassified Corynebacterium]MCS4490540.1 fumarylacetoacetate hydrolase family protein [Corynebacterium sp. ES2775-CONJ]MCS4492319.1 fumarylacetoacetate hydrolase family protein [Corynebacterium sp. ES2715-CONJ3]MCS4532489.1 fumarylacetoacetate hydrolase family protein [Corynebacterium sp. ES2730-CONJ]MCU9519884.1 fumarylacetoacetate hydrolase family protein [Corynebacterium sp. ES2794-CONJ1]